MGDCKTYPPNASIAGEFVASLVEFAPNAMPKPPPCSGLDEKDALTKWLVVQMWVGFVNAALGLVIGILSLGMYGLGISGCIGAVVYAFFGAWMTWFMFCYRDPPCCCVCIIIIEGWKSMHLVCGLLLILNAISLTAMNAMSFSSALSAGEVTTTALAGFNLFMTLIYNITWFFIGISLTRIGGKAAGGWDRQGSIVGNVSA